MMITCTMDLSMMIMICKAIWKRPMQKIVMECSNSHQRMFKVQLILLNRFKTVQVQLAPRTHKR